MISLRILIKSLLLSYGYVSGIPVTGPVMVGDHFDVNNCLTSAGYSWCESSSSCTRQWMIPCDINIECPKLTCTIYCDHGREKDKNDCDTCTCNSCV